MRPGAPPGRQIGGGGGRGGAGGARRVGGRTALWWGGTRMLSCRPKQGAARALEAVEHTKGAAGA